MIVFCRIDTTLMPEIEPCFMPAGMWAPGIITFARQELRRRDLNSHITLREINKEEEKERCQKNPEGRRGRTADFKGYAASRESVQNVLHRPQKYASCGSVNLKVTCIENENVRHPGDAAGSSHRHGVDASGNNRPAKTAYHGESSFLHGRQFLPGASPALPGYDLGCLVAVF